MLQPVQLRLIKPDYDLLQHYVASFLSSKEAAGRTRATLEFYRVTLQRYVDFAPDWPPTSGNLEMFKLHLRRQGRKEATVAAYH